MPINPCSIEKLWIRSSLLCPQYVKSQNGQIAPYNPKVLFISISCHYLKYFRLSSLFHFIAVYLWQTALPAIYYTDDWY